MHTGCPDCNKAQAEAKNKTAMCLACELGYWEWERDVANKRIKELKEKMKEK